MTTQADVDAADGECSLREAIVAANGDAAHRECPGGDGADVIEIPGPGTISLLSDLPLIEEALTLRGVEKETGLGIEGLATIDGARQWEILHFAQAAQGNDEVLRVERLAIVGGRAAQGGGIYVGSNRALEVADSVVIGNASTQDGGGIRARLTTSVDIRRSTILGNEAGQGGGGVAVQGGGPVTVVDSTISGNVATGPGGGLYVLAADDLFVGRSTFETNGAGGDGGGVAAVVTPARVELSTLVGNTADADDDDMGEGGGFSVAGAVTGTLASSIFAGNLDATSSGTTCPDVQRKLGAAIVTEGFNLVGANTCVETAFPEGQPNGNGDLVGTELSPIDPLLEPLDANGGPTPTRMPATGSPAVDGGRCPGAPYDQRGYGNPVTVERIVDDPSIPNGSDGCDIGAVEVGGVSILGWIFQDGFETGDVSRWSESSL